MTLQDTPSRARTARFLPGQNWHINRRYWDHSERNSSPVKDSSTWQMLRNRLREKLTHLLHQLSRIDVFQGAELSALPGSGLLVHIEGGGIVPPFQNRLRFRRESGV